MFNFCTDNTNLCRSLRQNINLLISERLNFYLKNMKIYVYLAVLMQNVKQTFDTVFVKPKFQKFDQNSIYSISLNGSAVDLTLANNRFPYQ